MVAFSSDPVLLHFPFYTCTWTVNAIRQCCVIRGNKSLSLDTCISHRHSGYSPLHHLLAPVLLNICYVDNESRIAPMLLSQFLDNSENSCKVLVENNQLL